MLIMAKGLCFAFLSLVLICSIHGQKSLISTEDNIQRLEHMDYYYNSPIEINEVEIQDKLATKSPTITLPYFGKDKSFKIDPYKFYSGAKNPNPEIETFRLYTTPDEELRGTMLSGPAGVSFTFINEEGLFYSVLLY